MLQKRATSKRAHQLKRRDLREERPCGFCAVNTEDNKIVDESATMFVIHNRTSYDLFEGIPVHEHLMLIPRKHHIAMDTLDDTERKEYIDLMCKYEAAGYSVYGRGLPNMERSMEHIHLHLLKLDGCRVKNLLYIDKPYLMIHGKPRKAKSRF